jgi:hypothetical protein
MVLAGMHPTTHHRDMADSQSDLERVSNGERRSLAKPVLQSQDKSRRPPMTIDMPTLLNELMVDGGLKSQCAKYRTLFRFSQQLFI